MTRVQLNGAFPRPEKLIDISRQFDRGTVSADELQNGQNHAVREVARLQIDSQLDLFVDGQLNWQDLFRPFSELFSGIEPGSLTRWFDNNTFYRTPMILNKIRRSEIGTEKYFRFDALPISQRKAILPGPYTFALLSQNNAYPSPTELVDDLAHALAEIVRELVDKGYSFIQFNEPCLSNWRRNDLELAKRGYEVLAKQNLLTGIQTYFGDCGEIVGELLDFPVDSIGVDLYSTSINDLAQHKFTKELNCGCIDGRNSLLESPKNMLSLIHHVTEAVEPRGLTVGPNCDLDFLPYSIAEKKAHLLGELKVKLNA